ncbi:MAG: excinuclease ABC subunit UvrA [Elusimicrobia bacterium]|nr:excinuclease ABC subunit UvrA [Elusimicrobiota bacterium]
MDTIKIAGARQHNLKNINLEIPKNKLVVITGLSGSGKSSLAFDTIYAEGQRRYVESLSAYARQFLEQMDKPDVDYIEGLSPSIAIQQHAPSRNPRSTVGTVTEIYDYLRLLFARIGMPACPECRLPVKSWSVQQIVSDMISRHKNKKIKIFSPLVSGRTGTYEELFTRLKKSGFVKVRVDGKLHGMDSVPALKRYVKHDIDLFVDELTASETQKERLTDSVELALGKSDGRLLLEIQEKAARSARGTNCGQCRPVPAARRLAYSEKTACPGCGRGFPELEPRLFSFNSPYGACAECGGLGIKMEIDEELVVPDPSTTISEGAIKAWADPITTRTHRWKNSWSGYYAGMIKNVCAGHSISIESPWKDIPKEKRDFLLYGDPASGFEGVIKNMERRYRETESSYVKEEIYRRFIRERTCPACRGKRLKKEGLSVFVCGKNIVEISSMPISGIMEFAAGMDIDEKERQIAKLILKEINSRLKFLVDVGLSYIALDRKSETLSGGEAQRIHLATQIGSGLTGVLYVLDEPTMGLHQKDNARLINTLKALRDIGNTLIVVEHDEAVIRNSDYIIDLGPGAGLNGGEVVAQGPLDAIIKNERSLTGKFLKSPNPRFKPGSKASPKKFIEFKKASQFNLKNLDVKIPIGLFTALCGVSGSGKSTLLYEIIYKGLARKLHNSKEQPGRFRSVTGTDYIDKVIIADQSPIGRTPRSNPATYTGVFTHIRQLFSMLPESKRRGYKPGRFSFNVKGGRCESCQGDGNIKIQMQFLPDVYVTCEACRGRRFNEDTLEIKFKGKNIAEILDMSAAEAAGLFRDMPHILKILKTMLEVGLDYIKLGQSGTTLSGGEAQRLKLADQLAKKSAGRTLYLLDEPTTGLHFADVEKLLKVLHTLVDRGNTVVVIEHNLDVIGSSDWIIELGPEGGDKGGYLTFSGHAPDIMKSSQTSTGPFLSFAFEGDKFKTR